MKIPSVIFCVFLIITPVALATEKPFPRGTMVVLPVDDKNLAGEVCWSDPNIIGVNLRTAWCSAERLQGTFNWNQFNQGITLAQANNKFVVLSISAVTPPSWVTSVVKTWTNSSGKTCPYPWDPNLQSFWHELVRKMGQLYDRVSCVHGIDMWAGGVGGKVADGTGIDCLFAPTSADCAALDAIAGGGTGSGDPLWKNACRTLCTMYLRAFPATPCFLHPGMNYGDYDPQSMSDITTWWLSARNSGDSLFNNEFSVKKPRFMRSLRFVPWPNTNLQITSIDNGMFQILDPIGSPQMNGQTLAEVFQNVENIVAVQIYPTDPGENTIINFNHSVGL